MSFVRYANQGATRNLPLSEDLLGALSFLPELGVEMEVFSGGQPAEGPNRVGSTRHDHGNAADVFFYKDGQRLDWSNPEHQPVFQEIVRRAKSNGVTGFGAGDGYMQPGSMHIGFGNAAVWGAGGKGANAPDWLTAAYGVGPTQARADAGAPLANTGGNSYAPQNALAGMSQPDPTIAKLNALAMLMPRSQPLQYDFRMSDRNNRLLA